MATYAIGDVHGNSAALESLLDEIDPGVDDVVVQLGDIVDRGPDVKRCVTLLLDLADDCEVIAIRGNHEEMMFDAFNASGQGDFWLYCGGDLTLESYDGSRRHIPDSHWEFFESMREWFETDDDIFVHAAIDPSKALDVQTNVDLRWESCTGWETPHLSGKRILCGHTAQKSGLPLAWDGWVCLDSKVYETGWLTALCCEQNMIYQAHESGEVRRFPLAEANSPRR